ncbi:hypothetical protein BGY98DRAFT_981945 [Russula aff. rugulosa BPL654]|nr:hypothetical protein BGY98DRAFT_981945 [Russula aff. rugulosa BPL654]
MQKRLPDDTLQRRTPQTIRPKSNKNEPAHCKVTTVGLYESSSREYIWSAPHVMAHLITLMGGNVSNSAVPLLFSLMPTR